MKYLIILLFLILIVPVQAQYFNEALFLTTNDTIADYTTADTLDWRVFIGGTSEPAWIPITDYITVAEKKAETTMVFKLSHEAEWAWGEMLEVRIRGSADVTASKKFKVGHLRGHVTLYVTPDTLLADTETDYAGSRIGGM